MKKALLTTTALVALSGASFADSVAVVNGGTSHHTHSPTVVFHGTAMIKYNVPLKTAANPSPEGGVSSDVDLDVTMTSLGAYSATISYGLEGNAIAGATVSVTTPLANISVGVDDANGGGADASDLYSDIDRMSSVGTDEDSSDWSVSVPLAGWTIAASGDNSQATTANKRNTSIGLTGSVGGLSITAGGKYKSGGASVSTNLMGATVTAAIASIRPDGAATNHSESGISVAVPMGAMTVTVNSTTVDSTNNWGVDVSTSINGLTIAVGTDSEEENTFKLTGPMGPVSLHLEYDSDDASLTDTIVDATVEAGVTYAVPGTKGTTISASYSNADDDFDAGTQVKMAFSF
jgi:hypothetical protein